MFGKGGGCSGDRSVRLRWLSGVVSLAVEVEQVVSRGFGRLVLGRHAGREVPERPRRRCPAGRGRLLELVG